MAKKTKSNLLSQIIHELKSKPMTAYEIADKINSNWDTVKGNLKVLVSLGLCEEKKEGKNRSVYSASIHNIEKSKDTLFGLPISEDQKVSTLKYYTATKKAWFKKTGFFPTNIQLQKTVTEMIRFRGSNIPYGWYRFGPVCLLLYRQDEDCSNLKVEKEIYTLAEKVVDGIKKYQNSISLINEIYNRNDRETYRLKISISQTLTQGLDKTNKVGFILDLNRLLISYSQEIREVFPEIQKEVLHILEAFVSIVIQIVLKQKDKEINIIRTDIYDCFLSVWKLLTTLIFFNDLKKYIDNELLYKFFGNVYLNLINDVEFSIDKIALYVPKEKVIPHPSIAKFAGVVKD